jgi:hypothetical protein
MNELAKLTRQHYEKNEAGANLLSKVTKILDSLPDGSLDSSQLAGLDQFHVMGLAATEQLARIAGIERGAAILDAGSGLGGPSRYLAGKLAFYDVLATDASLELLFPVREGRVRFVMGVCTADGARS